jgi:hypothetical protein
MKILSALLDYLQTIQRSGSWTSCTLSIKFAENNDPSQCLSTRSLRGEISNYLKLTEIFDKIIFHFLKLNILNLKNIYYSRISFKLFILQLCSLVM